MRVLCRHGHFAFYPKLAGEISRFSNTFDFDLVREEDYFTFEALLGAPHFSLAGKPYLGLPATKTFEGNPWQVMKANHLVYSVSLGKVVPKLAVTDVVQLIPKGYLYVCSSAILQPGARTSQDPQQILSYYGEFNEDQFYLRLLEFDYE